MKIITKYSTPAKKRRIDSSLLSSQEKAMLRKDNTFDCKSIVEGGENHWLVEFSDFPGKWFVYKPHCEVKLEYLITKYHFNACLPHASKRDLETFFEPLNLAFREFGIDTVPRLAAFIAQVAHESRSLYFKEEVASGAAYEWRRDLGNIYSGDGRRFKGRGIIQLTGRANYKWASNALGIDLVSNPSLATIPNNSCRIACLYWQSRKLNLYADWNNLRGFREITRRINGGYNGWNDRLGHWRIARKALHLSRI